MSDFDVMKAISQANGPIGCAPLNNLIAINKRKQGYELTIGIAHEWGDKIVFGRVVGALYLMDADEFHRVQSELAKKADGSEPPTADLEAGA